MPGRKIRDEADARNCLNDARDSGTPRVEWARAHGVDARSLNAWRVILERKDAASRPVELVELVPTTGPTPVSERPPLRVRSEGLVVEVPADFDDDHLLRVLRVVAAC